MTAAACASLLGSRLPDVDQPGARIHRRTRLERRTSLNVFSKDFWDAGGVPMNTRLVAA